MLAITLSNVSTYFNRNEILTPAEKFQKNLLTKFGMTVRKTQRNSLKRSKKGEVSKPGKPPNRQDKARVDIKETVFSFTDVKAKDVTIGMVLLGGKPGGSRAVPGVLEHSGDTVRIGRNKIVKRVHVEARPSAVPAFEKTKKKQLPGLIKGGIMREV